MKLGKALKTIQQHAKRRKSTKELAAECVEAQFERARETAVMVLGSGSQRL